MELQEITATALIIINCIASYRALRYPAVMEQYMFRVDDILKYKDYKRLVTSGFVHVSWPHLLLNMLSLFCFAPFLVHELGDMNFLLIYFGSLLGGSLLSLFVHRNDGDYSAAGASGALFGMVFAAIALDPGLRIGFFGLPFHIPGWAYGLGFTLLSIYGIRARLGNIGHDAHLGGGLCGVFIAIALVPEVLLYNYIPILLIIVPSVVFIYILARRPYVLLADKPFSSERNLYTQDDKFNISRRESEIELDKLLDKISRKGIDSLSKKEKERLDKLSGK